MIKHEDVVAQVNILDVLAKIGIEGVVRGTEFMARCPFPEHEDTTPSFNICLDGPKKGMNQCFGCGYRGNIVHFLQRLIGDEEDVARWLEEHFGIAALSKISAPTLQEIMRDLSKTQDVVADENCLVHIPLPRLAEDVAPALEYIVQKRIYKKPEAEKVLTRFAMRYCDAGYYRGRIIIPLQDKFGDLISFEAGDVTGAAEKKKLYPRGTPKNRLLFNDYSVSSDYVWLVEGVWDAVRLWSFGEPAVAIMGAFLSDHQASRIINKYQKVFLMFDGDDAGKKATDAAYQILSPYLDVIPAELWFGDPDELTLTEFRELKLWLTKATSK